LFNYSRFLLCFLKGKCSNYARSESIPNSFIIPMCFGLFVDSYIIKFSLYLYKYWKHFIFLINVQKCWALKNFAFVTNHIIICKQLYANFILRRKKISILYQSGKEENHYSIWIISYRNNSTNSSNSSVW